MTGYYYINKDLAHNTVCSVWDKGYRFGYQGSEKDIRESVYSTYFRLLDTRIGRWFSVDPEFQPSSSTYVSMDNCPILFNDPLGDKIIVPAGDRKHKRQIVKDLKKRDNWGEIKNTYKNQWLKDGRIFKKAEKNLSIKVNSNAPNNIFDATITDRPEDVIAKDPSAKDLDRKLDHLYINPNEEQTFVFDNTKTGGKILSKNEVESRKYKVKFNKFESTSSIITANKYLKGIRTYDVNITNITIQTDDLNLLNPAIYSFINRKSTILKAPAGTNNLMNKSVELKDKLIVNGQWFIDDLGAYDACHGFIITITIKIKKY
jgi:RHS repeat-associated protein